MAAKDIVVAIELGSTKITGIAGKKGNDGTLLVKAYAREDASQCIRKGVVYNIDKTAHSIQVIVEKLSKQLKSKIRHVYVGVSGQSVHSEKNTLIRDLPEGTNVTTELVADINDNNRAMDYHDMEILEVEDQEFRTDAQTTVDPVGVQCSRLEANYLNILQGKKHHQKIFKCFKSAGVEILEPLFAPFALADVILRPDEKRNGCVFVDLGADTTTVMVYHKDIMRHIAVLPIGANNITKDISSLQMDDAQAEAMKLKYASAYTPIEAIERSESYKIDEERSVESYRFIEIVEARVREIVVNVNHQIPEELSNSLLSGLILTGGGSNLKNISEAFARYAEIKKIRIAKFVNPKVEIPSSFTDITEKNAMANTLLGLLNKGDQNCCYTVEARDTSLFANEDLGVPAGSGLGSGEPVSAPSSYASQAGVGSSSQSGMQSGVQPAIHGASQPTAVTPAATVTPVTTPQPEPETQQPEPEEVEPEKPKREGIGTKFVKWLSSLTAEEK